MNLNMNHKKSIKPIQNKRYYEVFEDDNDSENNYCEEDYQNMLNGGSGNSIGTITEGSIAKGMVTGIYDDHIVVDVGGKVEGKIQKAELPIRGSDFSPQIGDVIDVYVERLETYNRSTGAFGLAQFNIEKVILNEKWEELENIYEAQEPVYGVIYQRMKGGCAVDIHEGIVSFLPGSQLSITHIKDVESLMYIKQKFFIISMNKETGNILVSRRAIMEKERLVQRTKFLETIEVGQIIEGVCKGIADYGCFINLGPVDGLMHITDMGWHRIAHPSECEAVKIGKTIKAKVISLDRNLGKLSLGLKQLAANPWDSVADKYKVHESYDGIITNLEKYGMFVKLCDGIEGLVHNSEITWSVPNMHSAELKKRFKVGQQVKVRVLSYEIQNGQTRMSLSMKQLKDNPWEQFAKDNRIKDEREGIVTEKLKDTVFVNVGDNMVCRLSKRHLLTGDPTEEELKSEFIKIKVGDSVTTRIISMIVDRQRVYLSKRFEDVDSMVNIVESSINVGDKLERCLIRDVEKGSHVYAEYSIYSIPLYIVIPKRKKAEMLGCFLNESVNCIVKYVDHKLCTLICTIEGIEYDKDIDFIDMHSIAKQKT